MATISPVAAAVDITDDATGPGRPRKFVWSTLTDADTADPLTVSGFIKRATVDIRGGGASGFGGATVVFQGSVDGTNFNTLTDVTGAAISLTAAGARGILDLAQNKFKPVASGGSSQDVDITLLIWTD